jgi:hypothetical protein
LCCVVATWFRLIKMADVVIHDVIVIDIGPVRTDT